MDKDSKNPSGYKTLLGVSVSMMLIIFSLFVHAMWNSSDEVRGTAVQNRVDLAEMKAHYRMIRDDLNEIKTLLKRRIPP